MALILGAAAGEVAEAIVRHYDADFDRIAAVTGQPTQWIAPRGTLSRALASLEAKRPTAVV